VLTPRERDALSTCRYSITTPVHCRSSEVYIYVDVDLKMHMFHRPAVHGARSFTLSCSTRDLSTRTCSDVSSVSTGPSVWVPMMVSVS